MLIKNGLVFIEGNFYKTNILIKGSKISEISNEATDSKVIDAKGKFVIPGIIDCHVHFRDLGQDHKEDWLSGSKAAVAGGVTTVIDMPNNQIPIYSYVLLDEKRKTAAEKSLCNFGFYMMLTDQNVETVNEIDNIAGAKLYLGLTTGANTVKDVEDIIRRSKNNMIITVHAEDNDWLTLNKKKYPHSVEFHSMIRDNISEVISVIKMLDLTRKYGQRIHFAHISSSEALLLIEQAKSEGLPITCEVTPHHLFLDESDYAELGNLAKMNPALKYRRDREALWEGIVNGVIDIIATDHAPHTLKEKKQTNAPAGVPGIETMLPLLLDTVNKGSLTLKRLIELVCENPARLFNLMSKGKLQHGYDADITIIDMELEKEVRTNDLFTKCGWSPFNGWKLKGWPVMTIVNGNIIYENGKICDDIKGKEVIIS